MLDILIHQFTSVDLELQYDKMWLPEELERIYKIAYKNISDQKIEDVLPPDDIKAIRETGTAIANIGNRIFAPKVNHIFPTLAISNLTLRIWIVGQRFGSP